MVVIIFACNSALFLRLMFRCSICLYKKLLIVDDFDIECVRYLCLPHCSSMSLKSIIKGLLYFFDKRAAVVIGNKFDMLQKIKS